MAADYDDVEIADLVIKKTERLLWTPVEDLVPPQSLQPTYRALRKPVLRVLDFGGGAGLHYFAAAQQFPSRPFKWAVVERPVMMRARQLETPDLKFFTAVDAAARWLEQVDLVYSNCALPYVDEPESTLNALLAVPAKRFMWARCLLADTRKVETSESRLVDHGPGPAPEGTKDRIIRHQTHWMDRREFMTAHQGFRLKWQEAADNYFFVRKMHVLSPPVGS